MAVVLKVDAERVALDDLIAIEDGNMKAREMRDLLARFVFADGAYVEEATARQQVGQMSLAELRATVTQLGDQIKESAVPKESGSGLS